MKVRNLIYSFTGGEARRTEDFLPTGFVFPTLPLPDWFLVKVFGNFPGQSSYPCLSPESGFFVAAVVDGEMMLLVGDAIKETYSRTRAKRCRRSQGPVLRREHIVFGNKVYNTKVEAITTLRNYSKAMLKFLHKNIFTRFGAPRAIISDEVTHFDNKLITGALQRKYWFSKLDEELWAHRTTFKTLMGMSPFKLVYGKACYLLVEIEHKAYCAVKKLNMDAHLAKEKRLLELNEMEEFHAHAEMHHVHPHEAVDIMNLDDGSIFKVNGKRLKILKLAWGLGRFMLPRVKMVRVQSEQVGNGEALSQSSRQVMDEIFEENIPIKAGITTKLIPKLMDFKEDDPKEILKRGTKNVVAEEEILSPGKQSPTHPADVEKTDEEAVSDSIYNTEEIPPFSVQSQPVESCLTKHHLKRSVRRAAETSIATYEAVIQTKTTSRLIQKNQPQREDAPSIPVTRNHLNEVPLIAFSLM
ncbi:hypothetical protein F3Y22_tig00001728pilonHSYRG00154 [Hibiscus syriacus]|uniref:Uncharacterized protein n=1 Tax=Hibiscus syriacus TaxID=106335 RepID=A0A6A3CWE9_HIBSY|nr:hypothetical protein F3Y22_tig00001728pilonHSYRG00154 [Hibiscus syriacus]